jgi:phytoene dehydrogenase-like protein
MKKSILIIGSGMGGLSSGIYGQLNGFDTTIFEMHSIPGGQCTAWNRNGYIFDGCIHVLGGGSPKTKLEEFWTQLGVHPCESIELKELIAGKFPDGTLVHNYCEINRLQSHLKEISPEDGDVIDEFINGVKLFQKGDSIGAMLFGSIWEKMLQLPLIIRSLKYFKYSLGSFSKKFKNPLLKKFIAVLHYGVPNLPLFGQIFKQADIANGGMTWPKGGSLTVAKNMASKYVQSGGKIFYTKKVVKIITENNRACGVELEDGSVHKADYIISNADGRKTIMQMLSGRYVNKRIVGYCKPNPDVDREFAVNVFLGVNCDLSSYPPAMICFLEKEETICGHTTDHLDLQMYGYDSTMAPEGKGVIKVELYARMSYFSAMYNDKKTYKAEKNRIAEKVIELVEKQIPNIRNKIEVTDVITLQTWERYMGGTHGWVNWPNKKFSIPEDVFGLGRKDQLPGLKNFYFTGQWATSSGALLMNAISGKSIIKKICNKSGIKFKETLSQ